MIFHALSCFTLQLKRVGVGFWASTMCLLLRLIFQPEKSQSREEVWISSSFPGRCKRPLAVPGHRPLLPGERSLDLDLAVTSGSLHNGQHSGS